jgi:hypothetical protein
MTSKSKLTLEAGHFYKSRQGDVWCCFRVDEERPATGGTSGNEHCRAFAIECSGATRVEYFFLDGRYDRVGKREHTLLTECTPTGKSIPAKPKTKAAKVAKQGPG